MRLNYWYHWRISQRSWGSGRGRQDDGELFVTIWVEEMEVEETCREVHLPANWMRVGNTAKDWLGKAQQAAAVKLEFSAISSSSDPITLLSWTKPQSPARAHENRNQTWTFCHVGRPNPVVRHPDHSNIWILCPITSHLPPPTFFTPSLFLGSHPATTFDVEPQLDELSSNLKTSCDLEGKIRILTVET